MSTVLDELKERVDLGWLVAHDLGQPRKKSGRWRFWLCPFHEDHDPSFAVSSESGRYKCFGCGESGDHIDWLMKQRRLSYGEAKKELERLAGLPAARSSAEAMGQSPVAGNAPPSEKWQERGRAFAAWAAEQLWTDAGKAGLDYLQKGGLTEETIKAWGLGWCPKWMKDDPRRWGLDGSSIWLPSGVVIACEVAGVLWYLKVRRFADGKPANDAPKYPQPRGGQSALFGADRLRADGRPLLLCEGERDSLLAWQELRDFLDVATLGGAAKTCLGRWSLWLLPFQQIFTAFDSDPAGRKGAAWWEGLSERVVSLKLPHSVDLTDFVAAGGDLRAWLRPYLDGLQLAAVDAERAHGRVEE